MLIDQGRKLASNVRQNTASSLGAVAVLTAHRASIFVTIQLSAMNLVWKDDIGLLETLGQRRGHKQGKDDEDVVVHHWYWKFLESVFVWFLFLIYFLKFGPIILFMGQGILCNASFNGK